MVSMPPLRFSWGSFRVWSREDHGVNAASAVETARLVRVALVCHPLTDPRRPGQFPAPAKGVFSAQVRA